ncbi:MAG: hypothetical protein OXT06_14650 [Rhodospirillaceae bacterium]|nr:hypothetical protein [Rhodospirillaceae bacterium]
MIIKKLRDASATMDGLKLSASDVADLMTHVTNTESALDMAKARVKQRDERIELLESFIIDSRGDLEGVEEWTAKAYGKLTEMMPGIIDFAKTIQRGTGSAANYENQFRHAEYRAKLVKENLRNARFQMRQMILAVASVADRTHNQVDPVDIQALRDELDQLSGYQEVMATIDGDPFFDGVMPELDLMEGTGHAGKLPAVRAKGKRHD